MSTAARAASMAGLLACTACLAAGQAGEALHPQLLALAPQVLAQGAEARLPRNLSRVLRLGDGREPPAVRQAVVRSGTEVHVYEVLASAGHAIVLLRVDEAGHRTEAFLLDRKGGLARAVGYEGSGEAQVLAASLAASGYEREALLWQRTARRALSAPTAPAPGP